MVEETTAVEQAPTPEPTAQEPAVEQQQEEPKAPTPSRRSPFETARQEVRRRVAERFAQREEVQPATEQPRDDKGEGVGAEESSSPEYRIEIPADHPDRRGVNVDAVTVGSSEQQRALQALLDGSYASHKEIEASEAELRERSREREELQRKIVSYEAGQAAIQKYKQSPEYHARVEKFNKLKEAENYGDIPKGTAREYWRGTQGDVERVRQQEEQTRWDAIQQERIAESGQAWVTDAWSRNTSQMPRQLRDHPEVRQVFEREVQRFDRDLQSGYYKHVTNADEMHKEFAKILHKQVLELPFIQDALNRTKQSTPAPPPPKPKPAPPADKVKRQRPDTKLPPRIGGMAAQKHAAASARQRASKWFGG